MEQRQATEFCGDDNSEEWTVTIGNEATADQSAAAISAEQVHIICISYRRTAVQQPYVLRSTYMLRSSTYQGRLCPKARYDHVCVSYSTAGRGVSVGAEKDGCGVIFLFRIGRSRR